MDLTRDEIAAITVRRPPRDRAAIARGFAFDSRTLVAGNGFVALRAERDGHDFVADAFARGRASRSSSGSRTGSTGHWSSSRTRTPRSVRSARRRATGWTAPRSSASPDRPGRRRPRTSPPRRCARRSRCTPARRRSTTRSGSPSRCSTRRTARRRSCSRWARASPATSPSSVRDRPAVDRRDHPRRARPRRAPRRSRRHRARSRASCSTRSRPTGSAVLNADCDYLDALRARSAAPVLTVGRGTGRGRPDRRTCGSTRELRATLPARHAVGERGRRPARRPRRLPGRERRARRPRSRCISGFHSTRWSPRSRSPAPQHGAWSCPRRATVCWCSTTRTTRARARCGPRSRRSRGCPCTGRRIAVLGEMRELGDDRAGRARPGRRARRRRRGRPCWSRSDRAPTSSRRRRRSHGVEVHAASRTADAAVTVAAHARRDRATPSS